MSRDADSMARIPGPHEHVRIEIRAVLALAVGVSLLVFALHLPSLRFGFVIWDDDLNVYQNPHIRTFDAHFFSWAFTDMASGNWQPLTWVSHALDYSLWGLNPFGYHLTNTILHAINASLATWLVLTLLTIRRVLPHATSVSPAGSVPVRSSILIASGFAGLLFGCHPLRAESVSWISCRTDLLCTLFYLLSILAYITYVRRRTMAVGPDEGGYRSAPWYICSFALFLLAAFSKPMAVTLPAVLLLLDWHPFGRMTRGKDIVLLCVEKLPFIASSVLVTVLTVVAETNLGAVSSFTDVPVSARLLVAVKALAAYIEKTIWPTHLAPIYPYPKDSTLFSVEYASALIIIVSITVLSILLLRKQKLILLGWAYYIITLLPVLGIIKARPVYLADRYSYLPSVGLSLIAGVFAVFLRDRSEKSKKRLFAEAVAALMILVIALLSSLTVKQSAIWKDSLTLWNHVIDTEGIHVSEAYNNRGSFFGEQGDCDRARDDFAMAIAVNPSDAAAYGNMAVALECKGAFDRALDFYNQAIRMNPADHLGYFNRGILYGKRGMLANAIKDYSTTLLLKPDFTAARLERANAFRATGRSDLALQDYQEACARGSEEACREALSSRVQ